MNHRHAWALLAVSVLASAAAHADRCTAHADGKWTCTYQERAHAFASNTGTACTGAQRIRQVRWQVPEGTPPEGGWPVVFFFNGTVVAGATATKPFSSTSEAFGAHHAHTALHEFLDDPRRTGKRYAVFAPEAPTVLGLQFWDTNLGGRYTAKNDHCFLPDLFEAIASGVYGPAAQFNMGRRFAIGISSGGYNTSRMAVSFNAQSTWAALAIVSASYATCVGPFCAVPATLPANHPPTKFYHGRADLIVPIGSMRPYFNRLQSQRIPTEMVAHRGGHAFSADVVGDQGVKAWFDRF